MFEEQIQFVGDNESEKYPEEEYCKCDDSVINEEDIYTCKKCKKYLKDVRKKK